jgi:hypothetical protein
MLKVGDIYKSDKVTLNGRKILAIGEPLVNTHGEERIPVKLEHPSGSHGEIYLKPEMVYGSTSEESTTPQVTVTEEHYLMSASGDSTCRYFTPCDRKAVAQLDCEPIGKVLACGPCADFYTEMTHKKPIMDVRTKGKS